MVRASGPSCVFSSISASKLLTTVHSGFDHDRPAHERNPSSLTFSSSLHVLFLNFPLTRVTRPRNRFLDTARLVERGIKVRRYGHVLRFVSEINFSEARSFTTTSTHPGMQRRLTASIFLSMILTSR